MLDEAGEGECIVPVEEDGDDPQGGPAQGIGVGGAGGDEPYAEAAADYLMVA